MPPVLNERSPNPLIGWQVDPTTIRTIGRDLSRPECVLAEPDGSIWTADGRGGVMHIRPDGNQQLITSVVDGNSGGGPNPGRGLVDGSLPNGPSKATPFHISTARCPGCP